MLRSLLHIIKTLWSKLKELEDQVREMGQTLGEKESAIALLNERIATLEQKGKKNSRNSSKPPSSDGRRKKSKQKNNRHRSGRASGAQKGNGGKTLKQVAQADEQIVHEVGYCNNCGADLSKVEVLRVEKRQVFDTSSSKIEVIEHQVEVKLCEVCAIEVKASYPAEVKAPVQYGNQIRAKILDLSVQHFLSYDRIQSFFLDWYGQRISGGLIQSSLKKAQEILGGNYEQQIRTQLLGQAILHTDETGIYIANKRQWLHVLSTPKLTLYQPHAKRGSEAIEDWGIVPQFEGRLIHDNYSSYATYQQCEHGLCHAHHLRELRYFEEEEQAPWAWKMAVFLRSVKQHRDQLLEQDIQQFEIQQAHRYHQQYLKIIQYGYQHAPPNPPRKSKRGKAPQHPQRNLLDRFHNQQEPMLAFIYDFDVPFDNNQAERDLRMIKTKQKVSGTFRSEQGAKDFASIRGYISTAKKNAQSVLNALVNIFHKMPFCP